MKNIKSQVILGILVLAALIGALVLVKQNQETRRGAYFSATNLLVQPSEITGKVGDQVVAQLFVDTANGAKINSIDTNVCFGPNLQVNQNNLNENVELNTEALSDMIDLSYSTPSIIGGGCIRLVAIAKPSIKPEDLKSGMVRIVTFKFNAVSQGSGEVSIVKGETKVGGYNPIVGATDSSLEIGTVTGAKYNIGGGAGTITSVPTCTPRPACLDALPHPCTMPEPVGGWCPVEPGTLSKCGGSCNSSVNPPVNCENGLICQPVNTTDIIVGASGICRNPKCVNDTDCVCGLVATVTTEPVVTNTPIPTAPNAPTATMIPTDSGLQLRFNMAFGVNTGANTIGIGFNSNCAEAKDMPLSVVVRSMDGTTKSFSNVIATKLANAASNGLAVYQVNLGLGDFKYANNIAVFVKGPRNLQVKYGVNHQARYYQRAGGELSGLTNDSQTTPVFDFTAYPLLPGDVVGVNSMVQDGTVDGLDFSYVKTESVKRTEKAAGEYMLADLNGNCKMESQDLTLLMLSLSEKEDQLY